MAYYGFIWQNLNQNTEAVSHTHLAELPLAVVAWSWRVTGLLFTALLLLNRPCGYSIYAVIPFVLGGFFWGGFLLFFLKKRDIFPTTLPKNKTFLLVLWWTLTCQEFLARSSESGMWVLDCIIVIPLFLERHLHCVNTGDQGPIPGIRFG